MEVEQRRSGARPRRTRESGEEVRWSNEIFQVRHSKSVGPRSAQEEKNERLGRSSLVLLFVLGVSAGLLNGGILAANAQFCKIQAQVITYGGTYSLGLLYFLLIMCTLVICACCACKYGSRAAAGSGLPEFKYLLGSEMAVAGYEKLISFRILVFKIVGLVLSVGGGLSVGSEGPLVHTAACVAFVLMKNIPEFSEILDSQSITKQIFAASAAVGVSSAFNAPVGGLLFSIEVTSTFYLVANYWRSFIAAMAGAVACNLLLITKEGANSDPLLTLQMSDNEMTQYSKWELAVFLAIGLIFGWLAHFYLLAHKRISAFMKPYNRDYPLICALTGAVITTFIVYTTKQYSAESVGVVSLVSDVLNSGKVTEMQTVPFFSDKPMEALLVSFTLRIVLTLIGTNILVPAGIFMPVTLIGGLLGRFVGHVVKDCGFNCYIPGYAMVGACAFSAGITHTISVSMIIVEMTGDLKMLLPCLVVSVIAAGITKAHGISVYDIGMINKGLQTFQLLLLEKNTPSRPAGSIMDDRVVMVWRDGMTVLDLIKKLQSNMGQGVFPLVEDLEGGGSIGGGHNDGNPPGAEVDAHPPTGKKKHAQPPRRKVKLVGCLNRMDLFDFLERIFKEHDLIAVIRTMLPEDAIESERIRLHDEKVLRARLEREKYTRAITNTILRTPMFSRTPTGARGDGERRAGKVTGDKALFGEVDNPLHRVGVTGKRIKTPHPKAIKANKPNPAVEGYTIVITGDGEMSGELSVQEMTPLPASPEGGDSDGKNARRKNRRALSSPVQGVSPRTMHEAMIAPDFSNDFGTPGEGALCPGNAAPGNNSRNYPRHRDHLSDNDDMDSARDDVHSSLPPPFSSALRGNNNSVTFPPTPNSPESAKSTDSSYIWNIINHAVASSADIMRMSLGMNPILLNSENGEDPSFSFDPMEPKIASLFSQKVVLENEDITVNYFPFSVNDKAPMEQLYVLFEMVKLQTIFVVNDGELRGMISRDRLLESLKSKTS